MFFGWLGSVLTTALPVEERMIDVYTFCCSIFLKKSCLDSFGFRALCTFSTFCSITELEGVLVAVDGFYGFVEYGLPGRCLPRRSGLLVSMARGLQPQCLLVWKNGDFGDFHRM